jgi:hypothetical protein
MGRIYTAEFNGQTITNAGGARDLFELTPGDDKPIRIAGFSLSQTSDLGDAEEEVLRLRIRRGNTTSGNGTSITNINPMNPSDAAAGFTAEHNGTTQATAGTERTLWRGGWNIRMGETIFFPEDMRPGAGQGQGTLILSIEAAPADDLTGCDGTIFVEEMG